MKPPAPIRAVSRVAAKIAGGAGRTAPARATSRIVQRVASRVWRNGGTAAPSGYAIRRIDSSVVLVSYEPLPDGKPDPGEVVWTWIPYVEDPTIGKDRPAVVVGWTAAGGPAGVGTAGVGVAGVGTAGVGVAAGGTAAGGTAGVGVGSAKRWLAIVPLTSKFNAGQVSVGVGSWDGGRRRSYAKVDQVFAVDRSHVRREGASLPKAAFDQVVAALN